MSVQSALNFLASAGPLANTIVTEEKANDIMLRTDGFIPSCGYLYNIQCEQVTPHVYRLSLKERN